MIVELLSNSTAKVDKTAKKQLYQDTFRTPEYFWFHPETFEFQGFRLVGGIYRPIKPSVQGWLWSQQLSLFLGVHDNKLRFFKDTGILVPSPAEQAATERQQRELAEQQSLIERQQRELAEQQARLNGNSENRQSRKSQHCDRGCEN